MNEKKEKKPAEPETQDNKLQDEDLEWVAGGPKVIRELIHSSSETGIQESSAFELTPEDLNTAWPEG